MKSQRKTDEEQDQIWAVFGKYNYTMPPVEERKKLLSKLNSDRIKIGWRPIVTLDTTFNIIEKAYKGRAWSKKSGQALHINKHFQHLASAERERNMILKK